MCQGIFTTFTISIYTTSRKICMEHTQKRRKLKYIFTWYSEQTASKSEKEMEDIFYDKSIQRLLPKV